MMPLLLGMLAGAADLHLVAVDGEVRPGRATRIEALVLDGDGAAVPAAVPRPDAGAFRVEERDDLPADVISVLWTPPARAGRVRWSVDRSDAEAFIDVSERPAASWTVPRRVDVFEGQAIRVPLVGEGVPASGDTATFASEPVQVELADDASAVVLRPEGTGARVVLVAIHDLARDHLPRIVPVRIIERATLSFDLEAGATLQVRVGSRTYGPFVSDGTGPVRARIEQYPGEQQAELVVADDLGNVLVTPYVLAARADPALTVITAGTAWPGALAPELLVAAATADGRAWTGTAPTCRGPDAGEMPLIPVEPGLWRVAQSPRAMGGGDVRVDCRLRGTTATHRVPAPLGIPVSVDLRVYPDEMSTDFPVAEVIAHVLDAAGERLSADALSVRAETGAVTLRPGEGGSRRGEYRGGPEAVRDGRDVLQASLVLPPGSGSPATVQIAHGAVPRGGPIRVHGRALDAAGRPVAGVAVRLAAGAASAEVISGSDGWASAVLDPGEVAAVPLTVAVGARSIRALRRRGTLPWGGGPGLPDLIGRKTVRLTAGRVSTLSVGTDTPVLYATPGARLDVTVTLYDRGQNLVTDEIPLLSVSEGAIGPPRLMPDGSYRAEYVPTPDTRGGVVTIVARAPTGSASATCRLRLELRPVRAAIGLSAGVVSNLGGITSFMPSVDADIRLPALSDQLMLRVGVAGFTASRDVDTVSGLNVKRLTLLPITVGALVRQDRGQSAGWLGLGATVAPYQAGERFDDDRFPVRTGVLPPGFTAIAGGARRIRGGEVLLEVRGTFLSAPGGDVGFTGQVGGLAALLGYRLVID